MARATTGEIEGRLGRVPVSEGFQGHVSALRHFWGNSETRTWLQRMKKLEPRAYEQDSDLLKAVAAGQAALGWTDYAAIAPFMKPGTPFIASSFADGDAGNILLVSGAAVRRGTPHKSEAFRALSFLLGERTQSYLADSAYEYPARTGMAGSDRFSLTAVFHPTFVDSRSVIDVVPTRVMLLGLALP